MEPSAIAGRAAAVLSRVPRPPRLLVLFGSHARGTAHAESDVDLGFLPGEAMSLGEELALEAELSRALGREVDLVRLDQDNALLRWRVARDGIVIHASPAVEAPRFFARAAIEHDDMRETFEDATRRFARKLTMAPT